MRQTPSLPARYFVRLLDMLRESGVDVSLLLRQARVSRALLERNDGMLPLDQVDRLLAQAAQLSGRDDLGFELGRSLRISSHSVVGYGMLTSASVDEGLRFLARYFRLITPVLQLRYQRSREQLRLRFTPALPLRHESLMVHLEATLLGVHGIIRELLGGSLPPHRVYLGYPAPPHAARYREIENAQCQFGHSGDAGFLMVFPAAGFARVPALADAIAFRVVESRCASMLQNLVIGDRIADWVRMMLREASEGLPSLKALAQMLNLSTRTLSRHLKREGLVFRELVREIAHEKACRQLAAGHASITQIALDLGYSDVANFARAFRRRSGMSPSRYRRGAPSSEA